MKVLVTGAAGFIGMHCALKLLERGNQVVGLDNLGDYYDVRLKDARLAQLAAQPAFRFVKSDISDQEAMWCLFAEERPQRVLHLAAQAGVRYSLVNPDAYMKSNLIGFSNILESCRRPGVGHLVFASSSSVYGGNAKAPFAESDPVDHPVCRSTRPPSVSTSSWRTHTRIFSGCLAPSCGSSPCTGLGAARTWRCSSSRARYWKESRSRSSTMAAWSGTSPTSTTSPKTWCGVLDRPASPELAYDP